MMTLLALLLALGQDPVDPGHVVATVLGRKITAGDIGMKEKLNLTVAPPASCAADDPVSKFQEIAWKDIARHYMDAKGLNATAEELREMSDRMEKFAEEHRKQRERELPEVEAKLKSPGLSEEERKKLETRLKTLRFMAETDEWQAAHPEESRKALAAAHTPWVEAFKLDSALYREFGGAVAVTKFGQVPVGARAALLRKYEKESRLHIADKALEKRFWASWEEPPKWPAAPDKVDLTPFWKRP
jgi:hypothetical protein